MQLDNLHRATLDVMCVAAWHFAGASFIVGMILGLHSNTGIQTISQQIISAIFMLSLFLGIGTAARLWMDQRQSRRHRERLAREAQRT